MRSNAFLYSLVLLLVLFVAACASGSGGYTYKPWDFGKTAPPAAQSAPGVLSKQAARETAPAAQTTPALQGNAQFQGAIQTPNTAPVAPVPANLPPVKVALLLPLTGEHEQLGQSMLKAAQMALFDIGSDNFELMPRDTKGTPQGAEMAARSALNDGAQLILGPVFSGSVRAVKQVIGMSRVNMIAFSTDWAQAGGNTYMMGFLPFDQVERITSYAAAQNLNRIGVLAPESDYGRVVVSSYQNIARRNNITAADVRTFPENGGNLSTLVRSFAKYDERQAAKTPKVNAEGQLIPAAAGADTPPPYNAVLMPVGGATAVNIAGLLTQNGLPPSQVRRLGTGLLDDPALARENALDGTWFAAPSPGLRTEFERQFRSTYGYAAPRLSTLAYDATALAAVLAERGLRTNGKPAFDKASIQNPNGFAGIDGIFRFREGGTAERGLAILEFKNGQIVIRDNPPQTFQK